MMLPLDRSGIVQPIIEIHRAGLAAYPTRQADAFVGRAKRQPRS
jgi:hypothetical protein